jgi:hypothetical protein
MYMAEMEEWVTIKDFDNYQVSSLGRVQNIETGRMLKLILSGGYLKIKLSQDYNGKSFSVHRLVALAFIENPEKKPQVNHKDKNRSNNNVSNLEWSTALENNLHRSKGVVQTTNQNIKIWRVDKDTNAKLEFYNSINLAATWCFENNYSPSMQNASSNISCSVRKVYAHSCGFKWIIDEQLSLENEEWKNVVIDGQIFSEYFVSNLGRFKNYKGIIMENYKPHHSGYIYVRVDKDKYALHRIMAYTFIENHNPGGYNVVNHIDGNKTNNSAVNLEWTNTKGNCQHNHTAGLIKCFTRKIGQYDLEHNLIKEFGSIVEAEKELKIKTIKAVLYKKQNTGGGFIFKYLD